MYLMAESLLVVAIIAALVGLFIRSPWALVVMFAFGLPAQLPRMSGERRRNRMTSRKTRNVSFLLIARRVASCSRAFAPLSPSCRPRQSVRMTDSGWPTWDEWLDDLDAETRLRAESLRDVFAALGAVDPEAWARSEVSEDFAQLGRFAFLRTVWRQVETWRDPLAIEEVLPNASSDVLEAAQVLAGRVAFDVAVNIIQVLDDEEDTDAEESLPGWRLMELGMNGEPTGRELAALHESFLDVDPRHVEAEDIRGW